MVASDKIYTKMRNVWDCRREDFKGAITLFVLGPQGSWLRLRFESKCGPKIDETWCALRVYIHSYSRITRNATGSGVKGLVQRIFEPCLLCLKNQPLSPHSPMAIPISRTAYYDVYLYMTQIHICIVVTCNYRPAMCLQNTPEFFRGIGFFLFRLLWSFHTIFWTKHCKEGADFYTFLVNRFSLNCKLSVCPKRDCARSEAPSCKVAARGDFAACHLSQWHLHACCTTIKFQKL